MQLKQHRNRDKRLFLKSKCKRTSYKILLSCILLLTVSIPHARLGPSPVNVEPVKMQLLAPTAMHFGEIVSPNDAVVSARTPGQLVQIAKVGTRIKKGEAFAQIVDQNIPHRLNEQKARINQVSHRLEFLNNEVKRLNTLSKRNLSAKTELDFTRSQRDQASAELEEMQSQFEQIKLSDSYQSMRAPFDGIIVERLSDEGELVAIGTPVIRLVQTSQLELSVRVPIDLLTFINGNDNLLFSSSLGEGLAQIRTVVPVAEQRSRLIEIRASLKEEYWPVGLDIKIAVPTGPAMQVLAVPRDAIVIRRDGSHVIRVRSENKSEQVMVTTGLASDRWIEIKGDINQGDRVIIRGAERIQPWQEVKISETNDRLVTL